MIKKNWLEAIVCFIGIGIAGAGCSPKNDVLYYSVTPQVVAMDSVPDIHILSEIRIQDNRVWLTYESRGEYGQRHVKSYRYDVSATTLRYEKEYFKQADGYYQLFAPLLFQDDRDSLYVTDRNTPSVYRVSADGMAHATGEHIITTSTQTPFAVVQEARQAFYKAPHEYLFIGREPKDGSASLFLTRNGDSVVVNEVCKIVYQVDYPSWMINFGKFTYHIGKQMGAYAYQLFPVLQFFNLRNGDVFTSVVPQTAPVKIVTGGADVWEQNKVQFRDITSNDKYLYALYWDKSFDVAQTEQENGKGVSRIIRYDWGGNVVSVYTLNRCLDTIGVSDKDDYIIGYDGEMCHIQL